LTWDEVDLNGGVIRLPPQRSKTRTGRVLPISPPLEQVLKRRRRLKAPKDPRVFRRDGVPVRAWRSALRDACRKAKVPHRLLHDCRRTAARNLIRAGVPERIAMLLTGHKTRAVFDRYNIVNEQELLTAGERLAAYVARNGG
jgi:integrase